jgi:GTP-binding protein
MAKPIVVIVGRPNVGKSTLFNRIVGRKAAIVEDTPGVTRDRNYLDAAWDEKLFTVVDTGGFYPRHDDNIFAQIKEQALFAIEEADIIVHLLDAKDGLNPYDYDLAEVVRASGKPVLSVVNKIDSPERERLMADFYPLGADAIMPVSATSGHGFDEFMDRLAEHLPVYAEASSEYPLVAIVGRPNVGKSTIVNALLGKQRLLVSPVPGTTRDPIDSLCSYYKRKYVLIDTAGIRRKDRHGYSIERFAMVRTLQSIERADVCVVLLDAAQGVIAEDQKIAGLVNENGKGAVFLLNKWDLVEDPDQRLKDLRAQIERRIWFFAHAPILTTSGIERKRITKVFPLIDTVMAQRTRHIPTPELNRFLEGVPRPSYRGKAVKFFYITQTGTAPPRFTIFTSRAEGIPESIIRNIESRLREAFGFDGTPVRVRIRQRT